MVRWTPHGRVRTRAATCAPAESDAATDPEAFVPPGGCEGGPELRVLFIGNSHTFVNDVPSLVRELACQAGTVILPTSATPGGASLIDHAASPATLDAIASDEWDVVVLQDQQLFPGWRLTWVDGESVPAVQTLVDAIEAKRSSTRRLFYMTWARIEGDDFTCDDDQRYPLNCSFEGMTRAVAEGYGLYAERTDSEIAPAGWAWAAVRADADAPLDPITMWNADGSHAELPGSYLSAAVLTGALLDVPTSELDYAAALDATVARYLRSTADDVVAEHASDPMVLTAERVAISCTGTALCSNASDAASVTISLSEGTCDALAAGAGDVAGRITTTWSCWNDLCETVPLGGWHGVPSDAIADGVYQVYVHVDVDGSGAVDDGDGEACVEAFEIGGGEDVTVTELTVR